MTQRSRLGVTSPGKLVVFGLIAVGCIVYIILAMLIDSNVDETPAWAMLTMITGYLVGNGLGAWRGQPQEPVFAPSVENAQKYVDERPENIAQT